MCLYPSNDQLESDIDAGKYAQILQVGKLTLIFIYNPAVNGSPFPGLIPQPSIGLVYAVAFKTGAHVDS